MRNRNITSICESRLVFARLRSRNHDQVFRPGRRGPSVYKQTAKFKKKRIATYYVNKVIKSQLKTCFRNLTIGIRMYLRMHCTSVRMLAHARNIIYHFRMYMCSCSYISLVFPPISARASCRYSLRPSRALEAPVDPGQLYRGRKRIDRGRRHIVDSEDELTGGLFTH